MNCTNLKKLLEDFVETNCAESEYPSELDELLNDTAKTGVVRFSWNLLKPLLKFRLETVLKSESLIRNANDDEELARQLSEKLDTFDNPPFTIQRVCELVISPRPQYKRRDKYMRAMEKNLMVVGTQEPDLTWMKNPRLTQLLEEPATSEPNHTPNHTPSTCSNEVANLPSQPDSAADNSHLQTGNTNQDVTHPSPRGLLGKRSLSERERSDEGCSNEGEQEVVLQEADSTTVEHNATARDQHQFGTKKAETFPQQQEVATGSCSKEEEDTHGGIKEAGVCLEKEPPQLGVCLDRDTPFMKELGGCPGQAPIKDVGMCEDVKEEVAREESEEMETNVEELVAASKEEGQQQKMETYKEAATGQVELPSTDRLEDMEDT